MVTESLQFYSSLYSASQSVTMSYSLSFLECLLTYISPLFFKKGTNHKISILQEKQEGRSVLHVTNASKVGYPQPILVILEDRVVIFLNITEDH
jgi:hypothetical protein